MVIRLQDWTCDYKYGGKITLPFTPKYPPSQAQMFLGMFALILTSTFFPSIQSLPPSPQLHTGTCTPYNKKVLLITLQTSLFVLHAMDDNWHSAMDSPFTMIPSPNPCPRPRLLSCCLTSEAYNQYVLFNSSLAHNLFPNFYTSPFIKLREFKYFFQSAEMLIQAFINSTASSSMAVATVQFNQYLPGKSHLSCPS